MTILESPFGFGAFSLSFKRLSADRILSVVTGGMSFYFICFWLGSSPLWPGKSLIIRPLFCSSVGYSYDFFLSVCSNNLTGVAMMFSYIS